MNTSVLSQKNHAFHGFSQFKLTNYLLNNLSQFKLTPTAKLVLLELSCFYNPRKADMFPKQKTIAMKLGISEASVIRAISELHKEGLIVSERKYTNRYKFTSRIGCELPQIEKIFESEKMQVDILQNDNQQTDNLQPHEHEQIKEQIKEPTSVSEYKILKNYAVQKGAKNINAYINALKKNGSAKNIVEEHKKAEAKSLYMKSKTEETLKEYTEIAQTGEAPTENWKALGEKLRRMCVKF